MPRPLRHLPPGHLVEITLRTLQGRLLMRPNRAVTCTIAGVIGRAQRNEGMCIHAAVAMGNHLHLLISPASLEQQKRFMNQVGSNVARKVGKIVGWRERFWGRRYRAIVVSHEQAAQVARLRYLLAHGAKEGFVLSPRDWPGLQVASALTDGSMQIEGIWRNETAAYNDRQAGRERPREAYEEKQSIVLSSLPCWRELTPAQHRKAVQGLIESIEAETLRRHESAETAPTGAAFVLQADPHQPPRYVKRSPAPDFHAASRYVRNQLRAAYAAFVASFRLASEALRRGDWPVHFPSGCFPPHLPAVPDST